MPVMDYWSQLHSKYRRLGADYSFRRPFVINADKPIISFTFDDFPRSALTAGGVILQQHGARGTYYTSLQLAGKHDASGLMFSLDDLAALREEGHELGCHTYTHCDSGETATGEFMDSVMANRRALEDILPGTSFDAFSFPKSAPRMGTKRKVGKLFQCCRGGGQTFNKGVADLNYLRACFLEQAGNAEAVTQLIDRNNEASGWLILATHDVCESPSRFGCTPRFFEAVVRYAAASGARLLPVGPALERLRNEAK